MTTLSATSAHLNNWTLKLNMPEIRLSGYSTFIILDSAELNVSTTGILYGTIACTLRIDDDFVNLESCQFYAGFEGETLTFEGYDTNGLTGDLHEDFISAFRLAKLEFKAN